MEEFRAKLIRDRSAVPDSVRFYALDDGVVFSRDDEWRPLFESVLSRLNVASLLLARPTLPFADLLVARAPAPADRIHPRDSEVKTFLHDIPFIRRGEEGEGLAGMIADRLRERKGIIIEGMGFVAVGSVTLEQAYINYSSLFHGTFVKYLSDLLYYGFRLPGERESMAALREWLRPLGPSIFPLAESPPADPALIMAEMVRVGRATVELGLVDSFFGNVSAFHEGVVYISQTGAPLDELEGCIDPVPMDNSSTCGITASSELPVHRRIYETSDYRTILHGHPKFSVIMSMYCEDEEGCPVADCGRDCPRVRMLGDIPVVSGEIGAGGVAEKVPPVVRRFGRALVYGHGPFCAGASGFAGPFADLLRIENFCRERYFALLRERWGEGHGR